MNKIQSLISKYKHLLIYLVFGVLTTLVNYLVYYPLYNLLHLSGTVSNIIAWAVAVIFAFITNKPLVFQSCDWSIKTTLEEFWKFTLCRVGSGALETGFIFLTVDILHWNGNLMKLVISVVVVALNYLGSKLFVFKK